MSDTSQMLPPSASAKVAKACRRSCPGSLGILPFARVLRTVRVWRPRRAVRVWKDKTEVAVSILYDAVRGSRAGPVGGCRKSRGDFEDRTATVTRPSTASLSTGDGNAVKAAVQWG